MRQIQKVAVIGGGMMGPDIACMSCLAGHDTVIIVRRKEVIPKVLEQVSAHMKFRKENKLFPLQVPPGGLEVTCNRK